MIKRMSAYVGVATILVSATCEADNSSVQLIGRVQAELQSIKIDGVAGGRRQTALTDNVGQSRFGFRINEDLGNGLSAIAFVDWRFGTGAGTGPFPREQWVGFDSKRWGNITFGRTNGLPKTYGGSAYDLFYDTSLQLMGSGGAMYAPANGFGVDVFVDHSIRYESPRWGAIQFAVLLSPSNADQADATLGGGNTGGKGNGLDYQLAGRFTLGTGEIVAGYSRDNANDLQKTLVTNGKNGSAETVWMLGGKWQWTDLAVFGQYFRIRDALAQGGGSGVGTAGGMGAISTAGCGLNASGLSNDAGVTTQQCNTAMNTNGDGNIWALGVNYKLGNNTLVLQGGRSKADAVAAAPERKAVNLTLGGIHALSKRTTVFGGYQRVNVSAAGSNPDRKTLSIGMRHNF